MVFNWFKLNSGVYICTYIAHKLYKYIIYANQYPNQCELFHRKNTIFGVDTCMTPNFKPEEWSIYKQKTEAEATQDRRG